MIYSHDCRDAFSKTLLELAEQDERIVAVCNDSVSSSKLVDFRNRFPDRLINVGIAEQNMIGIGAGLANGGKVPFVCGASCFLTARAFEQIKIDLAYSESNVKLCGVSSGIAYGPLGPTHHSTEDVALMRSLPHMMVIVPADPRETSLAVRAALEHAGPVYLRISRTPVPDILGDEHGFEIGRFARLRDGGDVSIIANGTMTARALEAAELLSRAGIEARVLNASSVKPIDRHEICLAARETQGIITVEEHTIFGGLGSAVAEVVASEYPTPVRSIGIPDVFAPTGTPEFLFRRFGLTPENIRDVAFELLDNN